MRITVHQGEDLVQPFQLHEDITGRSLTFTVWDSTGAVVFAKTIGVGITITDALAGNVDVVVSESASPTAPGRYRFGLAFSDAGDVNLLADGSFVVLLPRAV